MKSALALLIVSAVLAGTAVAETNAPAGGTDKTAIDQSNDPRDLQLTAEIRRRVVGDDTLSMRARNVTIITDQGVVTLRGAVASEDEAGKIQQHAREAGAATVNSDLKVE